MQDFGIRPLRSLPYAYPAPSLAIDTYIYHNMPCSSVFVPRPVETAEYCTRRVTGLGRKRKHSAVCFSLIYIPTGV